MRQEVQSRSSWLLTLVTLGALKTRGAVTRSGHRVAELVRLGTLAHLVAVVAVGAWKTSWRRRKRRRRTKTKGRRKDEEEKDGKQEEKK